MLSAAGGTIKNASRYASGVHECRFEVGGLMQRNKVIFRACQNEDMLADVMCDRRERIRGAGFFGVINVLGSHCPASVVVAPRNVRTLGGNWIARKRQNPCSALAEVETSVKRHYAINAFLESGCSRC
jgi:hypothetical protein